MGRLLVLAMAERDEDITEDGMDLFRELLRYYPIAKVKSYYVQGRWMKRQIITDTNLIMVHREEGGAPPPVDIDDVPMPELPGGYGQMSSSTTSRRGPGPPAVPPVRQPVRGGPPEQKRPLTPAPPREAPPARAFTAQGADHRPTGEGRMIQNFVDKWGLDATRTKLMFSRLLPSKRQMVLETFPGGGADELRQYIARCERENAWGGAKGGTKRGPPEGPPPERNMRARTDAIGAAGSRVYSRTPPDMGAAEAYKQRAAAARASYGSSTVRREPPGAPQRYPPASAARASYGQAGSSGAGARAASRSAAKPTAVPKTTPTPTPKADNRPGDLIKNLLGNLGI